MIYERNYVTHQGNECFMTCLQNYFKYFNYDVDETDIVFAENGFNAKFRNEDNHGNKTLGIFTDCFNSSFDFLNYYKIKYSDYKDLEDVEARKFLVDCIQNEIPITIKMKPSCLKYNKIYEFAVNGAHYINIIGIRNEELFISDGSVPTFPTTTYHNWVNSEIIYRGWKEREKRFFVFDWKSFDNAS